MLYLHYPPTLLLFLLGSPTNNTVEELQNIITCGSGGNPRLTLNNLELYALRRLKTDTVLKLSGFLTIYSKLYIILYYIYLLWMMSCYHQFQLSLS